MEILIHALKLMSPYSPSFNKNGFVLNTHFQGFTDQTFDMRTFDKNLNYPRESVSQKIDKFVNTNILPLLRSARPGLSDKEILNSYLIKEEVGPILFAGYTGDKPYKFAKSAKGFTLECGFTDFRDQRFDLGDYDERLNLKPGQSRLAEKGKEITDEKFTPEELALIKEQKEHETRREKVQAIVRTKFGDIADYARDIANGGSAPDMRKVSDVLDSIGSRTPQVQGVVAPMKQIMDYMVKGLQAGQSIGEIEEALHEDGSVSQIEALMQASSKSKDYDAQAALEVSRRFI